MSKKGRQGRSKKISSKASKARVLSEPPVAIGRPAPPPSVQASGPSDPPSRSSETSGERRDDSSLPPVELDHPFFAASSPADDRLGEAEMRDPRLALKTSAAVARRRAQLSRYVMAAVAAASALCLAALVKAAVAHSQAGTVAASSHVVAQLDPLAAPSGTAATAPAPAAPAAQTVADTAAPGTTGAAAPSAPDPEQLSPAPDPKAAAREKASSRRALESGKVRQAIEAGELSVALDPTDGEAWLILGAAYQQKGDAKQARRCYRSCLEQGQRGPKGECAAMLR
jgi:tetratricopeptide (TPR) repeat protein